jgi:PTH1 family peptidyl-tRNA hydrolase
MRILAGLGNPGAEYEATRHNAGFWLVDELASKLDGDWRAFKGGELAEVRLDGEKSLLFKPMQYMNRSGEPIRQLLEFYKMAPEELCVAADDVYLAPGTARIRKGGENGGHNGWKSVIEQVTPDYFWRVRIGAGLYEQHPLRRGRQPSLEAYVLQPPPEADRESIDAIIDDLLPELLEWLRSGILTEKTVSAI